MKTVQYASFYQQLNRIIWVLLLAVACVPERIPVTPNAATPGLTIVPDNSGIVFETPRPTPIPERIRNCDNAPQIRLIVQERGRVTFDDPQPLNIREGPGRSYRAIRSMPVGSIFFVLGAPYCDGEYSWFRVQYDDTEGWIAEGFNQIYYVEPYLPG